MAIAYKSQGAGVSTETSGAALSPLCPATVDAGDILIAHVFWEGTTSAPATPTGWDLLDGPRVIETTIARHWVFGKIAAGTEDGAAVAFGAPAVTTQRAARIYSFSGRVAGAIADLVRGFAATSHATDPQMPSVTTTVAGARAVALVAQNDNNAFGSPTGESGGDWVEAVAEYTVALTPGLSLGIETCIPTADPGTVSGGAMATTNDPCGVIGFEIRPSLPTITGSGSPDSQSSTADGSGASSSSSTDGAITAQVAVVDGTGAGTSTGTGALAAQASSADGEGAVGDSIVTGDGALSSQSATVSGEGVGSSSGTDGAIAAQAAAIEGDGLSSSSSTDGAITAQAAVVDGAGAGSSFGEGALPAQSATVDGLGGVGELIYGAGALVSAAASAAGAGLVSDVVDTGPQVPLSPSHGGTWHPGQGSLLTYRDSRMRPKQPVELVVLRGKGSAVSAAASIQGSGTVSGDSDDEVMLLLAA